MPMKQRTRYILVAVVAIVVVVAALGLYLYNGQQQHSKQCSESAASLVAMFGKITLPAGASGSTLSLTATDTTCTPITGIMVSSIQPELTGVANTSFVQFNGALVGPTNPLPGGQLATGSLPVNGVQAGQKYVLLVTVTFSSGLSRETETMVLYPES